MVRRADFRLTVWLVTYASLAVSSIVLGDFSTLLCSARNDGGGRCQRGCQEFCVFRLTNRI